MRRGRSRPPVDFFLSHITESLHWQLVGFSKNFWQQNLFMDDTRGYHVFPSQDFCITVSKIFTGNSPLFQKTSGSENKFWMRGGYHVSPTKIFLSHITKNFHCELFIFSEELSFIENFSWNGWGNQFFVKQFFCLALSKKLKGNSSVFRKNSGGENFYGWEKGISRFFVDTFLSHIIENFHWKLFGVSKNFWQRYKFVMMREWDITFFCRYVFVLLYRKLSLETLRCFKKILAAKTFFGCEVDITFLQQMLFCLTLPKNFIANISLFQKNFLSSKPFHEWAGEISVSSNIFLSHVIEKTQGELLGVPEEFWWRKFLWMREWDITFLCRYFFVLFFRNFHWKIFGVSKTSGSDKFVWMREWDITFFRRKLFVSLYRKKLRGTLRRLGKILAVTMYYGWEAMSSFSVEVFLSHIFEKFHWNLFDVSKKFWQRNQFLDARGISRFSAEHFCLALPNFFSGNSSWFQKKMVSEEIYGQDRGHRNFP